MVEEGGGHPLGGDYAALAARIAVVAGAERLILLKSAPMMAENWAEASRLGYVDSTFASVVAGAAFAVEALDLRSGQRGAN